MNLRRYAVALAVATFVLLIAGGLVSTTDSGLACPDWPLCEGKWIPPMVDGKEYEHTHRLIASFVGAMTFGLLALVVKYRRQDRLLVGIAAGASVLVIIQALLGALTVILRLPWWVSTAHLGTAMVFFSLAVSFPILLSRRSAERTADTMPVAGQGWFIPVALLTWAQVVAGAFMRHLRAGLACGYDVPLCLGELWPASPFLGLHAHMLHRVLGIAVAVAILALAWKVRRDDRVSGVMGAVSLGVVIQIALGIVTITTGRDLAIMNVHSTLGAALLAGMVIASWRAHPSAAIAQPSTKHHAEVVSASLGLA